LKVRRKPIVFAVHYALSAFNAKPNRDSCFREWPKNDFIKAYDIERFRARLQNRDSAPLSLKAMQDDLLQKEISRKSSAFIFSGKTREERGVYQRLYRKLDRSDQRLVLNWVTNRNVGRWKACRRCGNGGADKAHLEVCFWGVERRGFRGEGPSMIEEELARVRSERDLAGCVEAMRALVGAYQADGRDAEPP
jgi:hypothetical protein